MAPPPASTVDTLRQRRPGRPPPPARSVAGDLRAFCAWPAAASLVTLLSAAVLMGSLAGVVGPGIGDAGQIAPRWACLAVLVSYLGCMLGVVALLCRWQAGNSDALGASGVGVTLLMALGVVLDLTAGSQPWLTAGASVASIALAAWWWRLWNRTTGGETPMGLGLPLVALACWGALVPSAVGLRAALAARHPAAEADLLHPMTWWVGSAAVLLVVAVACWLAAVRAATPWGDSQRPWLSRPIFRWLLAGVLLVAAGVHADVAGYVTNCDFVPADALPLVAVVALWLAEMLIRHPRHPGRTDGIIGVVLAIVAVVAVGSGGDADGNRGPGSVVAILRWAPTAALGGSILALALAARRRPLGGGLVGAAALILALVAVLPVGTGWHLAAAGAATLALALVHACMRRAWRRALALVLVAQPLALCLGTVQAWLVHHGIEGVLLPLAGLGSISLTTLLAGGGWPALVRGDIAACAAWGLTAAVLGFTCPDTPFHAPILGSIALVGLCIGAAWRRGERAVGVPVLVGGLPLLPHDLAWAGVWIAFLLLGAAVAIARHRLRALPAARPAAEPLATPAPAAPPG